ncbi:MAG: hypothetical protein U0930_02880 [Pirellulales bacterium]
MRTQIQFGLGAITVVALALALVSAAKHLLRGFFLAGVPQPNQS